MKLKELLNSLSSKQSPATVEQLETMILAAEAERAAAIAGVAEIAEARLGLLKNDDEAALDQNDRQEQLFHRTIEKADYALAELRPRLVEAQAARRLARWNEIRERYRGAFTSFCDAYATAYDKYLAVAAIMGEAQNSGFVGEARNAFHTDLPVMIDAEAQKRFRADVELRSADPAERPQLKVPARLASQAPPQKPAPQEPVEPRPKPRPAKLETATAGETLVTVLRGGYESPISGQCNLGDVIALPNPLAAMAVRAGAVEFHNDPDVGGTK